MIHLSGSLSACAVTVDNMVDMFVGKVSKLCFEADIAVRVE